MVCKYDFFSSHSISLEKGDVDVFFHRAANELKVPLFLNKLRACRMNCTSMYELSPDCLMVIVPLCISSVYYTLNIYCHPVLPLLLGLHVLP